MKSEEKNTYMKFIKEDDVISFERWLSVQPEMQDVEKHFVVDILVTHQAWEILECLVKRFNHLVMAHDTNHDKTFFQRCLHAFTNESSQEGQIKISELMHACAHIVPNNIAQCTQGYLEKQLEESKEVLVIYATSDKTKQKPLLGLLPLLRNTIGEEEFKKQFLHAIKENIGQVNLQDSWTMEMLVASYEGNPFFFNSAPFWKQVVQNCISQTQQGISNQKLFSNMKFLCKTIHQDLPTILIDKIPLDKYLTNKHHEYAYSSTSNQESNSCVAQELLNLKESICQRENIKCLKIA